MDTVANHVKPYWPTEATTASDSEDLCMAERLRVETKVNVELHPENKLNHTVDAPQEKEPTAREINTPTPTPTPTPTQSNSNNQPEHRKGEQRQSGRERGMRDREGGREDDGGRGVVVGGERDIL